MNWTNFLNTLCQQREYSLTHLETEVLMCLKEDGLLSKEEWRQAYIASYSSIQDDAFTQRLKSIYKKFDITVNGSKLPILHRIINEKYQEYQKKNTLFSGMGLTNIHSHFPNEVFQQKIDNILHSEDLQERKVDILQTFAPNLDIYTKQFIQCVENDVSVRILLAWPYSEAAKLREDVLRKYANNSVANDLKNLNICDQVIGNLETLQGVIEKVGNTELFQIKLYDTLPSLAIYRAGHYLLAGLFLHGTLAVDTFQLELSLDASNNFVADTLKQDFELMWDVARPFSPEPSRHWRSDLKILFTTR
jgi:hypothetical protein